MSTLRYIHLLVLPLLCTAALAQMPEVAPGVTLTATQVSVVDRNGSGAVSALPLHSALVATDPHIGSNIAKGLVYANQHQSIQLQGKSSANVVQSTQPSFYVRMPDDQRDLMRAQLTLVRMRPTDATRIAVEFTANAFGGHRKRRVDEVAVTKDDVQGGDWVRVTPAKPVVPGEYGLMFLPQDQYAYSMTIYDISVVGR